MYSQSISYENNSWGIKTHLSAVKDPFSLTEKKTKKKNNSFRGEKEIHSVWSVEKGDMIARRTNCYSVTAEKN